MGGRRKGSSDSAGLTPLELQMMQVLWRDGASSVQRVQQRVAGDLAYTTVQTVLNALHQKGKVRRKLRGRAFEYRAVVAKEAVMRHAVRDFVNRMFGGSTEDLVMSLIRTRQLDADRIAALAAAERENDDE
ncbi:MAG TPA: BlaI/MecI/CopY family transcriptional regulator [Acidobacteriaceae bacterium]|nr:BlaI/MecI/CopY family transcriptional regulator [Acidobacteriaceae bacterium]